jgi:hypothetical protein
MVVMAITWDSGLLAVPSAAGRVAPATITIGAAHLTLHGEFARDRSSCRQTLPAPHNVVTPMFDQALAECELV